MRRFSAGQRSMPRARACSASSYRASSVRAIPELLATVFLQCVPHLQLGMIRTPLDDATRDRLNALRRTALPSKARDRMEMIALSDAGWSAPRIAAHLGYCAHTVRGLLKDFLARGL